MPSRDMLHRNEGVTLIRTHGVGDWMAWEKSDTAAPAAAAAPPRPDWPEREGRARAAGEFARRKLRTGAAVARTPPLGGGLDERRCFVVLQTAPGVEARHSLEPGLPVPLRGFHAGGYRGIAGYVEEPRGALRRRAVFHGFASQREARCYWVAAVDAEAWQILPPRA